jgi:hypothetical protein
MHEALDLPAALAELAFGNEDSEPLEETLDRLVTPDFVQRINGTVQTRAEYLAHVRDWRKKVTSGELRVLEQVSTPTAVAGRYIFTIVPAGGQQMDIESHLFARIEAGRIARLIEVARQAEVGDDDNYLASA